MSNQPNKLLTALGFSAIITVITFILTRFLDVRCTVTKDPRGAHPQTITDSNKNTFDGTFQPAFFNINVNINNHNQ